MAAVKEERDVAVGALLDTTVEMEEVGGAAIAQNQALRSERDAAVNPKTSTPKPRPWKSLAPKVCTSTEPKP